MLGDCGIVNHFFAWTVANRGNRSIQASYLLASSLFGVTLPAASLYIVDTLEPVYYHELENNYGKRSAGREVVKEAVEELAESLRAARWVKDGKDDRDDK